MSDEDRQWTAGYRAAWTRILQEAVRALGYNSPEGSQAGWIAEREGAIAALRSVCGDHDDNEWSEDLHLADVIEKHLARHLEEE